MKIAIPNDSRQGLGGGWTFQRNLIKGLKQLGETVVDDPFSADVCLIPGVTMVTKETFNALKEKGIKIVVRLDNVPRNSRNRNTGTSRLRSFAQRADEIIWQSRWARSYLIDFIQREGEIVYNGVDNEIFRQRGGVIDFGTDRSNVYLYSRFNRDETKMWEVAWYKFQLIARGNPDAKLIIVGKFSDDLVNFNFDFFRGEKVEYLGIVDDPYRMAQILRSCKYFLATYFNDAFSNTYLEALKCGMELYEPDLSGGTKEMIWLLHDAGLDYFSLERMTKDYLKVFQKVLGIDK